MWLAGLGWEAQSEDKQLCSLFEEKIKKIFVLKKILKGFLFFSTLKRKEKNKKIFNGLKENIQK